MPACSGGKRLGWLDRRFEPHLALEMVRGGRGPRSHAAGFARVARGAVRAAVGLHAIERDAPRLGLTAVRFLSIDTRATRTSMGMKIFFSAGEPSGDLHGANLIRELRGRDPSSRRSATAGREMAAGRLPVARRSDGPGRDVDLARAA